MPGAFVTPGMYSPVKRNFDFSTPWPAGPPAASLLASLIVWYSSCCWASTRLSPTRQKKNPMPKTPQHTFAWSDKLQ